MQKHLQEYLQQEIRRIRRSADYLYKNGMLQLCVPGVPGHGTRYLNLARTHFEFGRMWLGKALGALDEKDYPYPESYKPENCLVSPAADSFGDEEGLKYGSVFLVSDVEQVQEVKRLRLLLGELMKEIYGMRSATNPGDVLEGGKLNPHECLSQVLYGFSNAIMSLGMEVQDMLNDSRGGAISTEAKSLGPGPSTGTITTPGSAPELSPSATPTPALSSPIPSLTEPWANSLSESTDLPPMSDENSPASDQDSSPRPPAESDEPTTSTLPAPSPELPSEPPTPTDQPKAEADETPGSTENLSENSSSSSETTPSTENSTSQPLDRSAYPLTPADAFSSPAPMTLSSSESGNDLMSSEMDMSLAATPTTTPAAVSESSSEELTSREKNTSSNASLTATEFPVDAEFWPTSTKQNSLINSATTSTSNLGFENSPDFTTTTVRQPEGYPLGFGEPLPKVTGTEQEWVEATSSSSTDASPADSTSETSNPSLTATESSPKPNEPSETPPASTTPRKSRNKTLKTSSPAAESIAADSETDQDFGF